MIDFGLIYLFNCKPGIVKLVSVRRRNYEEKKQKTKNKKYISTVKNKNKAAYFPELFVYITLHLLPWHCCLFTGACEEQFSETAPLE